MSSTQSSPTLHTNCTQINWINFHLFVCYLRMLNRDSSTWTFCEGTYTVIQTLRRSINLLSKLNYYPNPRRSLISNLFALNSQSSLKRRKILNKIFTHIFVISVSSSFLYLNPDFLLILLVLSRFFWVPSVGLKVFDFVLILELYFHCSRISTGLCIFFSSWNVPFCCLRLHWFWWDFTGNSHFFPFAVCLSSLPALQIFHMDFNNFILTWLSVVSFVNFIFNVVEYLRSKIFSFLWNLKDRC